MMQGKKGAGRQFVRGTMGNHYDPKQQQQHDEAPKQRQKQQRQQHQQAEAPTQQHKHQQQQQQKQKQHNDSSCLDELGTPFASSQQEYC
jgi:hypothetical protein